VTVRTSKIGPAVTRRRSFMAQPFKHPDSGIYYLRRKVPEELRPTFGEFFKRSLKTRDPAEAKRLHALEWANCEAAFAVARAQLQGEGLLTPRDALVLAGRWYQQELAALEQSGRFERWLASGSSVRIEQADHFEEHSPFVTLREALDGDDSQAEEDAHKYVSGALKDANLPIPPRHSAQYAALHSAFLDHYFKLSEAALSRYSGDWRSAAEIVEAPLSVERTHTVKAAGRRLMEVFEEYASERMLTHKKSRAVMSTLSEYRARMQEFTELVGDPPIAQITRAVVREYRDAVARLPVGGEGVRKLCAKEKIAKADAEGLSRVTAATVSNKLRALSSVLSYALRLEYVRENPVVAGQFLRESTKAVRVERASGKERNHYDKPELEAIFSSAIFSSAGWRPPRAAFGEAWYWMPLLLYYTGARLEELAQLQVRDVCSGAYGPFLSILNADGEEDGGRGVKTAASRRDIPIHPDLSVLGFTQYVADLPQGQVFPGLSPDPKGYYGTNFGRRWSEYLRKFVKLQSPASPSHGFRHTFKTLCRAAGIHADVHDAITGHSGGNAVARAYGEMPMEAMSRAIALFPAAPGLKLVPR
jgi:integrase